MSPFPFLSTHLTLPLSVLLLFHHFSAAVAQLLVQPKFYTDNQCKVLSTQQATASIPISKCIVTTGLGSISFQPVPCSSANVQLVAFADTACGSQLVYMDLGNECSARINGDMAAIMFTCNQPGSLASIDPGTPTATSTIAVGPVANAAPTATQSKASDLPTSGGGSATNTQTAATGSPSGTGGGITNGNSTGGSNTASSSATPLLSTSDIISIAVGLGVGIPTIVIGLLQLRKKWRNRQINQEIEMTRQLYPNPAYSPNRNHWYK